MHWQLQEAKQRFSELVRSVHDDGPQIVTRHGAEDVAIIDISEYRRLTGQSSDLRDFLLGPGPSLEDLDLERPRDPGREIDLEVES